MSLYHEITEMLRDIKFKIRNMTNKSCDDKYPPKIMQKDLHITHLGDSDFLSSTRREERG